MIDTAPLWFTIFLFLFFFDTGTSEQGGCGCIQARLKKMSGGDVTSTLIEKFRFSTGSTWSGCTKRAVAQLPQRGVIKKIKRKCGTQNKKSNVDTGPNV